MNHKQPAPVHSFRLQLVDVSALVVGYGMAAVLFRAFWPKTGVSPVLGLFAVGFYLWLGMAMSGPILLMRRTAGPREAAADNGDAKAPPRPARTWAELAWLLIGVYWIVMGLFILPIRLQSFQLRRHGTLRPGARGRHARLPDLRTEIFAPTWRGRFLDPSGRRRPALHLADRLVLSDRAGANHAVSAPA